MNYKKIDSEREAKEAAYRKQLQDRLEADRLGKTALDVDTIRSLSKNIFYVYAKTYDIDEGREFYYGYNITKVESFSIGNRAFAVLVYDKGVRDLGLDNIMQKKKELLPFDKDTRILMKERHSNVFEPVLYYFFSIISPIYIQCKHVIDVIL